MPDGLRDRLRRAATRVVEVGAVGAVALAIAYVVLELWQADLRVPFAYSGGDGNFNIMLIKGVIENGWFLHNPDIGFPLGQNLLDYPTSADNLHFVAFRVLSLGTDDPAVILNVFYVATYAVTAMTAYVVLRVMGRMRATALVFALLFTFLPFHIFRGENHVFLSAYQGIPLAVLLLYWVFQPEPALLGRTWRDRRAIAAIVMALVLGMTGAYYGVFAALLLGAAGGIGILARWPWRRWVSALVLSAVVGFSLVANLAPSLIFRMQNGTNHQVTHEDPLATEAFGLKIAQLVLPVEGHRVDRLAHLNRRSHNHAWSSEGAQQLGAVGAAGFLGLLAWSLMRIVRTRPAAEDDDQDVAPLAFGALVSALVATIGGFSLVIALAGLTEMRSWNRISLVIGFCSLAFVALLLERGLAWTRRRRRSDARLGYAVAVALPLFLVVALFDQTTPAAIPDYDVSKQSFLRDRDLVHRVDAELPNGAAVFQLPYIPFPEFGPLNGMTDYDHIRGYVHSRALKWSYGEVKGRNGNWQSATSQLPADEMIPALIGVGFSAIWLDGAGYTDGGDALAAAIERWAGPPFVTSHEGRYRVFDLRGVPAPGARDAGQAALRPVLIEHSADWQPVEHRDGLALRSASGTATLELENNLSRRRSVTLRMLARSSGEPSALSIRTPGGEETVQLQGELKEVAIKFSLPPGRSTLRFDSSARYTVADLKVDDDAIAAAKLAAT